jgi:hypothetical protein
MRRAGTGSVAHFTTHTIPETGHLCVSVATRVQARVQIVDLASQNGFFSQPCKMDFFPPCLFFLLWNIGFIYGMFECRRCLSWVESERRNKQSREVERNERYRYERKLERREGDENKTKKNIKGKLKKTPRYSRTRNLNDSKLHVKGVPNECGRLVVAWAQTGRKTTIPNDDDNGDHDDECSFVCWLFLMCFGVFDGFWCFRFRLVFVVVGFSSFFFIYRRSSPARVFLSLSKICVIQPSSGDTASNSVTT